MMKKTFRIGLTLAMMAMPVAVHAQDDHSQHAMPAMEDGGAAMAYMDGMAKVQLQYGKDPDIRKLSEAIVVAQEGEIAFLKGWLDKHGKPAESSEHAGHMPAGMAFMEGMEKMNEDMNAAMTGDPDRDFVTMMIPHHQGAIDMAKVQLEYGKDGELHKLSGDIVKAQESEIAMMKDWLARH
jgi:uncharacterized protein (DUF305 family)